MWLNILLFILTACTTTIVGAIFYVGKQTDSLPDFLLAGWVFSVPLMGILLIHEMGHYLSGRRYGLNVTLPYFIPAIPPLGTFGAFIKIKSPIPNNRVLMRVGAMGPIAGAMAAIPILTIGLAYSEIGVAEGNSYNIGASLLMEGLVWLRFGHFSWEANILLHPTAMAAWFGLFVTAMNLLPIGQLDGGHVIYALFGRRTAKIISYGLFFMLIPLGIALWHGWFMFAVLVVALGFGEGFGLGGLRHPSPMRPDIPLDPAGRAMGIIAIILFIITFVPVPISIE
jgi:membrane-associated protease RseP (regulator of RpoE activity)